MRSVRDRRARCVVEVAPSRCRGNPRAANPACLAHRCGAVNANRPLLMHSGDVDQERAFTACDLNGDVDASAAAPQARWHFALGDNPLAMSADTIAALDTRFDQMFPVGQRSRSHLHWTPLDVALRACTMLTLHDDCRVLDVGSGVGKLCPRGCRHHQRDVVRCRSRRRHGRFGTTCRAAPGRATARVLSSHRSNDLRLVDVRLDLFFTTHSRKGCSRLRSSPPCVRSASSRLSRVRERACSPSDQAREWSTYYGIGGDMPPGFSLIHREPARENSLCVWIRDGIQ